MTRKEIHTENISKMGVEHQGYPYTLQEIHEINNLSVNATTLYANYDPNQTIYAPLYPHGYENESFLGRKYHNDTGTCDSETTTFQIIVYFMYISIFVIAVFGNAIVCVIVHTLPRMRTVTNYFIANLAVGDIMMALFCIPPSFISMLILGYWPFGEYFCKFVSFSQAVSVLVSAYTLVAISVDRYIALMWPLRPRLTKRQAKYIIALVWLIALITALPIPIFSQLDQPPGWHENCGRQVCTEKWPKQHYNSYYTFGLMAVQFKIPVTVLIFTYTRIAIAIWGKKPPGEAENVRDQRMAKSKRKMIKMMVIVVIVFTVCWVPFNVLMIIQIILGDDISAWQPLPYFWFAFHWLAMSHSCYNPIIYCYMNNKLRGGFVQILCRIPGLRQCYCIRQCARQHAGLMGPGLVLTGVDDISQLQRVNTCTTYIRTRKKTISSTQGPCSCTETALLR